MSNAAPFIEAAWADPAAPAGPTRRAILARLALGDVSMNGRVGTFAVSEPAIARRLEMLDAASREIRGGVA
ncbi:hypothetical protein [Lysobacter enzymogenes]|uniref:hypothetical protein n=1 Tax=Lysobacter enzymogenes TaxID=69 RepID=UPI000944BE18|nr:hypothetical protein [Lysobacter enzymogenes]